jgi:hypothetical protein
VSVFGTKLSFYEGNVSTGRIFPPQIMKTDPSVSEDLAPYSRWCGNDILEAGIHE